MSAGRPWSGETWIRHLETMGWEVIQRIRKPTAAQRARIAELAALLRKHFPRRRS